MNIKAHSTRRLHRGAFSDPLERLKLNKSNPAAAIKQIPSFTAGAMAEAVWLTALQRMLFVVDPCDG